MKFPNMSDDDRDIDVESDEEDDSDSRQPTPRQSNSQYYSQAEKRAHHNALERKRRDHIKDSFTTLRESVPVLRGEKVASRAQILKKAAEHIKMKKKEISAYHQTIENITRQNNLLESQIRSLEKVMGLEHCEWDDENYKDIIYNDTDSDSSDMDEPDNRGGGSTLRC